MQLTYLLKRTAMLSSKDEIAALNADNDFMRLMEESGLTLMLADENCPVVVQGLITQLVLSKRIAMLDHFAAGLEILDVLPAVHAKPDIFESLFVASAKNISPDSVKSVFRLKPSASELMYPSCDYFLVWSKSTLRTTVKKRLSRHDLSALEVMKIPCRRG